MKAGITPLHSLIAALDWLLHVAWHAPLYSSAIATCAGFRQGAAEGRATGYQKGLQQTMQAHGPDAKRA
jgi:hypothetical protein